MRIIGIDLGTTSIKAVEIDSAFGRYEVQEYHEQKIEPGTEQAHAAARLLASLPKAPDRIVMSLKTRQLTFRNLQLPTRDKKAVMAAVGFEMDDELPFSIENAAFDYTIISQSKQGTQAHVAATLERVVGSNLDAWNEAGIDPDLVTTEAWAYRTLLNRILSTEEQENPVLLVQMGHEHTTFYVHWRGIPILARDINWGGNDLTMAICQKYQITMEQAENAKLDHGFVIPPSQKGNVTPEQVEFSDALSQPLERLIGELRQVELTAKNITNTNVRLIYTSGGTALLPGLTQVLEQILKTRVKTLPALSSIATSGVTYSENTDAVFLLSASLALCMVGSDRSSAINFRKGAFAKQGHSREFSVQTLKRPLMAAGAVALFFFASVLVQSSFYTRQINATNTELESSVKSFFALSSSAVRTYMANLTTLRTKVTKELTKERELGKLASQNAKSPLNFLKEISSSVPKSIVLDMTQFQVGAAPSTNSYLSNLDNTVSLTFLVGSPDMVTKLEATLAGKLTAMQKSKVEEATAPGGATKRWKVTFTGKPTEESFGKWN
jgi:general secretion pathway protein L